MLQERSQLPAVLQSLGCIAQTAMPVFETRESEIEEFIRKKILECSSVRLLNPLDLCNMLCLLFFGIHLYCVFTSGLRRTREGLLG